MPAGYVMGFAGPDTETDIPDLPVQGRLPDWLAGTLVRNGSALFDANGTTFRHWFDGQAMLHRFDIGGGTVSYRNRFLDTGALRSVRDRGRIGYLEFATDPCGSIFSRYRTRWKGKATPIACEPVGVPHPGRGHRGQRRRPDRPPRTNRHGHTASANSPPRVLLCSQCGLATLASFEPEPACSHGRFRHYPLSARLARRLNTRGQPIPAAFRDFSCPFPAAWPADPAATRSAGGVGAQEPRRCGADRVRTW